VAPHHDQIALAFVGGLQDGTRRVANIENMLNGNSGIGRLGSIEPVLG
jgi:hypothetical protein